MNHPYDCPCVMCDPCQARWRQENKEILEVLKMDLLPKKEEQMIS